MSTGRWQRHEREVARALGTERLLNSGSGQPDCRAAGWAVQVKTRGTVPEWLFAALDQAARDAAPDERPAVVLVAVRQGKKARRLALMSFEHFAALVGGEQGADEAGQSADEVAFEGQEGQF